MAGLVILAISCHFFLYYRGAYAPSTPVNQAASWVALQPLRKHERREVRAEEAGSMESPAQSTRHVQEDSPASGALASPNISSPSAAVPAPVQRQHKPMVAVCLGFTSRTSSANRAKQAVYGIKGQSPLFNYLIPTLCKTMSPGFRYSLWVAYDHDDPLLSLKGVPELMQAAMKEMLPKCEVDFRLMSVPYSGNPTWAQNDAVVAAHKAGADYFYRVNDDTVMVTSGWTEVFVKALSEMRPPGVGVVGPHHSGGNTKILTYDFTSRKHVEIFGFHYPREFRSWWGDDWITLVYSPQRMRKIPAVKLDHKLEAVRYTVGEDKAKLGILQREVDKYKSVLADWLKRQAA
eukprot:CAMPEP_0177610164 /NCGR_PEP_ID=MMETSP0419_2-20121207/19600_1 /TAXON_ID=582737 /ORGANISM="Tetraselmis sp., Strain GSL018" /LENGTH=346 /DNA_ID=CAMNT_0019105385 /DNA_START=139 /DNA_END=1179 /DNA_ORIENTATION=+